ncbi:MAG: hypothetical protein U5L45_15065 [Saprospiraceae bacterium]|nr:hypothetical protein [Saprospiraceae bacterium]
MARTIQLSQKGRNIATFFEEQNAWVVLGLLCLGYATTMYIQDTMILTKEVYYNTLGEQLTIERIDQILEKQAEWKWVSYLLIPVVVVLQAFLVALCLNCGTIMMNYKIRFRPLFTLVLRSSVVFLLWKLLVTFIFLFSEVQFFDDLITLNKFALAGFVSKESVPSWLMYPLSILNIFEVVFWFLLTFGMSRLLQRSFKGSFGFVSTTYGLGLLMWMVFIIFLQLNFS